MFDALFVSYWFFYVLLLYFYYLFFLFFIFAVGLLTLTAFQFVKSVVETGVDAVAFLLAFCALFHFTDKYTAPLVLIVAAIAGQVLY